MFFFCANSIVNFYLILILTDNKNLNRNKFSDLDLQRGWHTHLKIVLGQVTTKKLIWHFFIKASILVKIIFIISFACRLVFQGKWHEQNKNSLGEKITSWLGIRCVTNRQTYMEYGHRELASVHRKKIFSTEYWKIHRINYLFVLVTS